MSFFAVHFTEKLQLWAFLMKKFDIHLHTESES